MRIPIRGWMSAVLVSGLILTLALNDASHCVALDRALRTP